jgi:hypothetical protein
MGASALSWELHGSLFKEINAAQTFDFETYRGAKERLRFFWTESRRGFGNADSFQILGFML